VSAKIAAGRDAALARMVAGQRSETPQSAVE
jgi:hypothetical protein